MILIILGKYMLLKPNKVSLEQIVHFSLTGIYLKKAITKISLVILIGDIKKAEANGYKKYTLQSNAEKL